MAKLVGCRRRDHLGCCQSEEVTFMSFDAILLEVKAAKKQDIDIKYQEAGQAAEKYQEVDEAAKQ
eukprot:1161753-Pelagomonas_calceolata.AAC.4